MRALLVDPSLFTGPYDAALSDGLKQAGVDVFWATRPLRPMEEDPFRTGRIMRRFYRLSDRIKGAPQPVVRILKGVGHLVGLLGLLRFVRSEGIELVHIQWALLPMADLIFARLVRGRIPIVFTVHDPTPYNGDRRSKLETVGFEAMIRLADAVIVHTQRGKNALTERGHNPARIHVVAHGPLSLTSPLPQIRLANARWTIVLFGQLKPYKGIEVLVEALGRMTLTELALIRVIVAGEPLMSMEEVRILRSRLADPSCLELRLHYLSEPEMAELFAEADTFVFPYRDIDASGAYFLIKSLGRWVIASNLGVFAEQIGAAEGELVPPGNPEALTAAILRAARGRPKPTSASQTDPWQEIGMRTAAIYRELVDRKEEARSRRLAVRTDGVHQG